MSFDKSQGFYAAKTVHNIKKTSQRKSLYKNNRILQRVIELFSD